MHQSRLGSCVADKMQTACRWMVVVALTRYRPGGLVHSISSPQPGSNRPRPAHGLVALATAAALALVGCSPSDDSSAPAVDAVGSTVVGGTTVPATVPGTSSLDSAASSADAGLSVAFADSLIVFQSGGRVQTGSLDGTTAGVVASEANDGQEHPDPGLTGTPDPICRRDSTSQIC